MNGERIIKFAGQGSVYVRCLDPLEDEDNEEDDAQFLKPTFSEESDNDLGNQRAEEDVHPPIDTIYPPETTLVPKLNVQPHPADSPQLPAPRQHAYQSPLAITSPSAVHANEEEVSRIFSEEMSDVLWYDLTSSITENVVSNNNNLCPSDILANDNEVLIKTIRVHRSLIREDMLHIFSDPSILNVELHAIIINQHGHEEAGEGSGVLREVFLLFWKESYESYMLGESERVPYIRHDFNRKRWEAVGRILVKGYAACSYFPYKLSKAFLIACLFGESSVTCQMLQDSFKHYLSQSEASMLDACLSNGIECEDEELLEFLSAFDCKRRVTKENLIEIVTEVAHKEIIQKPQYVADCWAPIVSELAKYFPDVCSLNKLYDSIIPTNAKVISILHANPVTPAEGETLSHLKRFIRGLDEAKLATFLRFSTASDVIVTDSLKIAFTNCEGLQRRPIAHTCGFTLEVPSTYSNFCELREEFMGLLNSGEWEMSIV